MLSNNKNRPLEEKHIPIPIVDNDELAILINSIQTHVNKAGIIDNDNQVKINK